MKGDIKLLGYAVRKGSTYGPYVILHSFAHLLLRLKMKLKPAAQILVSLNSKGQEASYLNMQLHLELDEM